MNKFYIVFILLFSVLFTNAQSIQSITTINPLCNGDINIPNSSGNVDISVDQTSPLTWVDCDLYWTNPTTGFTFQIATSRGANLNFNFPNLSSGDYRIDLTDTNDITGTGIPTTVFDTVHFTLVNPAVLTPSVNANDISCNGFNDGSVVSIVNGGTSPYTYSWSNGAITADIFNLAPGLYTVTVTDTNGCTSSSDTAIINEPSILNPNGAITQNVVGFGNLNGVITASISGGTPPYQYRLNTGSFQSNPVFSNLGAGIYTVTYRDTNNCSISESFTVTQPIPVTGNINIISPVSCYAVCDGEIEFLVSGGTAPYLYSINGGSFQPDSIFNNLCGDSSYSITVRDVDSSMYTATVYLTQPNNLTYTTSVQTNYNGYPVSCSDACDGEISIDNVTGGAGAPITYSFDNGNTYDVAWSAVNLCAGTYYISVMDGDGCVFPDSLTLDAPNVLSVVSSPVNVTCDSVDNGFIDLNINGGVGPYTYSWSNLDTTEDITGLAVGDYSVVVTDLNGCTYHDTSSIFLDICGCTDSTAMNYNPTANVDNGQCYYCPLSVTLYPINPSSAFACDGQLGAYVPLGTYPISYYWSNGAPTTSHVINGLCNDTFSVTIVDALGCGVDTTILLSDYIGCTDASMFNYDATALFDDGSCIPFIYGCLDSTMFNYCDSCNSSDGSCYPFVYGCTDINAANYNPLANTDDGSCFPCVYGCMDITMFNYDSLATCNYTCIPYIYGCTDSTSINYDANANTNDGSCIPYIYGCTDPTAINYYAGANTDDGSCCYVQGCMDNTMWNFDINACISDTCIPFIYGCMDPLAANYDPNANTDNGSCFTCGFSSPTWLIFPENIGCDAYATIDITSINPGPLSYNWSILWSSLDSFVQPTLPGQAGLCLGMYTVTVEDSVGCIFTDTVTIGNVVLGCMDSTATNYNPLANIDNGTCCAAPPVDLTLGQWHFYYDWGCAQQNDTLYYINYNNDGTWNNSYSGLWEFCGNNYTHTYFVDATVYTGTYSNGIISGTMTDSISSNTGCFQIWLDSSTVYLGCTESGADNYDPTANFNDGSCIYYGCTDDMAQNYDPIANTDDGSCTYLNLCNNPVPDSTHVTDIVDTKVRVRWNNMTSSTCNPRQYRVSYREIGTSVWSSRNVLDNGLCQGMNQSSRLITGLDASTCYEYKVKAWYCYTSGASAWSPIDTFCTAPECPNVGNFAVSTPLTTRATFTWDASNGPYSFARIKLRVDSISNPTAADWQNAGGFGVVYPTFTRNKNGLIPGETYRGQCRTWCDPNGGSYKSSGWTPLVFWTQPTSIRLTGETAIDNLEIYPNPSRDIFNIRFTSQESQDLYIKIINIVGEVVYTEDLSSFTGEYVNKIDLLNFPKGIYILKIDAEFGDITKQKLILQ